MRTLLIFSLCMLSGNLVYPQERNGCIQGETYDEEVELRECPPCRRNRNLLNGHYIDEQDPTEELEQDTSWPSQKEEFSDQLFTPNGGPW